MHGASLIYPVLLRRFYAVSIATCPVAQKFIITIEDDFVAILKIK